MIIEKPKIFCMYIVKDIFKNFFIIFFGLLILFFAVDFFETTNDSKTIENGLKISTQIVLYRIPNFLENILHFIILLSGLFTFYRLSNNSEIVVVRASGRSIFQITKLPAFIAFLFGIFVVMVYNPISSSLNVKSERLKNIYFKNDKEDLLELANGIWFKQRNLEPEGGSIIIRSSKVYRELLTFNDVMLTYLDNKGNFIKRIDTAKLKLNSNNTWTATDNFITRENKEREFVEQLIIPTGLTKKFVSKTIKNDYESIYNIPFWKLRSSINDLKQSGFDTLKFEVRYYYMMTIPFLFAIMILISAYFGIVNARDGDKYLSLVKGIALGFIIFFSHNIITELTNAEKLTILDGSVFIILVFTLIATMLLMKKDTLNNYNGKIF